MDRPISLPAAPIIPNSTTRVPLLGWFPPGFPAGFLAGVLASFWLPRALLRGETGPELADDRLRNKAAYVTAVRSDLLDQARAQERVQRIGGYEQRLDLSEAVVHLCPL